MTAKRVGNSVLKFLAGIDIIFINILGAGFWGLKIEELGIFSVLMDGAFLNKMNKLKAKGMLKDRNRVIDEQASRILKNKLHPDNWQIYRFEPDIAKDYSIELVEKGNYLGITFLVQQKGQKKVKQTPDGKYFKFKIETKYLAYYEKIRLPVFLALIDVTKEIGYWIFIQKYLRESFTEGKWRSQKYQTLYIPANNTLDELGDLRKTVYDADTFMAANYPGILPKAIRIEQERLETLDPRFNVKVMANERGQKYFLDAKEEVKGTFVFKGKEEIVKQKISDLIDKGKPTTFENSEVEVIGAPILMEAVKANKSMTMRWGILGEGSMLVRAEKENNTPIFLCNLPMNLEGGLKEIRFTMGGKGNPLVIKIASSISSMESELNITVDFSLWKNKSITKLQMFREINALATATLAGYDLIFEAIFPGASPIPGKIFSEQIQHTNIFTLMEQVKIIDKARQVAEFFEVERYFSSAITKEDIQNIDILFALVNSGEYSYAAPQVKLTFKMDKAGVEKLLGAILINPEGQISFMGNSYIFPFLGSNLDIGPYITEVSHISLTNEAEVRSQISRRYDEIEIECKGSEVSRVIHRLNRNQVISGENKLDKLS